MNRAKETGPARRISSRRPSAGEFPALACSPEFWIKVSPTRWKPEGTYMAQIDALFNLMFSEKASDLHLSSGNPPILRINGELTRVDAPPLQDDQLKVMLYEIAPDIQDQDLRGNGRR